MSRQPMTVPFQNVFFRSSRQSAKGLAALGMVLLLLGSVVFLSSAAQAGTLEHFDFAGVMYLDVTETSTSNPPPNDVPLYGAPITIGDSLAFFETTSSNPSIGFNAQAGGGAGDITDGFLNLVIMAKPGIGITDLTFSEGGDYTMAVLGNALAQVSASLNIFELSIVEVDGASTVGGPIVLSDTQSVTFNLPPDSTTGVWNLSSTFDLDAALSNHVPFTLGATKIVAKINNTLTALSQPGSVAGIFKKNFDIDPEIRIPEPTTCALALLGLTMVVAGRRRKI